jgi:hypothetical protein
MLFLLLVSSLVLMVRACFHHSAETHPGDFGGDFEITPRIAILAALRSAASGYGGAHAARRGLWYGSIDRCCLKHCLHSCYSWWLK